MEKDFREEENLGLQETFNENMLMASDLLENFPKHFHKIVR